MKPRTLGILAGVILVSAASAACSQSTPQAGNSQASQAKPFDQDLLHPADLNEKAPETFDVQFVTSKGEFVIRVTRAWAPNGADRFYNLEMHHYFDGAKFFRVFPDFMAQFGISPYPEVNKAWENASIQDDPVKHSNTRGMLSFAATSQPNSRSTQLFINFKDNSRLDPSGFAPIGIVISGMENVDQIYSRYGKDQQADQDQAGKEGNAYFEKNFPKLDSIKSATLVTSPPAAAPKSPSHP
jgi:peptidyl-prolyl cis-trans isomerase A (cyclophilin A)